MVVMVNFSDVIHIFKDIYNERLFEQLSEEEKWKTMMIITIKLMILEKDLFMFRDTVPEEDLRNYMFDRMV